MYNIQILHRLSEMSQIISPKDVILPGREPDGNVTSDIITVFRWSFQCRRLLSVRLRNGNVCLIPVLQRTEIRGKQILLFLVRARIKN